MKNLEYTPITWVQENSAIKKRRYTKKANKENFNEILSGLIWATFIVGVFFVGIFM